MFHWTGHNIRVHIFTCVPALQIAHLMRLKAARAGLHLSVRELPAGLAGIAMMGSSPTPRRVTVPSGAVDSPAIRRGRRFVKCTSPLSNGKPAVLRTSVAGHRVRRRSCVCFCGCGQARACARGRILSGAGESGGVLARVGWCGCLVRSCGVGGGVVSPGGTVGSPKPGSLAPRRVPRILPAPPSKPQAEAALYHHAQLHDRLRPGHRDRVGRPVSPSQHTMHTSVTPRCFTS